jgi:PIN domain nuclease of toxin-antitoxin system
LFGYPSKKKIVKSQDPVAEDLKNAISNALDQGKLSCKSAWEIASRFKIHKMKISGACEAMGVKIAECQLGAF